MNGTAYFAVTGHGFRFKGVNKLLVGVVGGMHGLLLGDYQASATLGTLRQIVDMPLTRQIILGEVGQVGGKGNPIRHNCFAYLER